MTQDDIVSIVADIYNEFEIDELGFNVIELCHKMNIDVYPYSKFNEEEHQLFLFQSEDGFGLVNPYSGRGEIYYNDCIKPKERITMTICHEIGHLYLDHSLPRQEIPSEEMERSANLFALVLYTPLIILHEFKIERAEDIQHQLHISGEWARNTEMRLLARYDIGTYRPSKNEEKLLWIFKKNRAQHLNK